MPFLGRASGAPGAQPASPSAAAAGPARGPASGRVLLRAALSCVTWLGCLQNLELSRQHHKNRGSKQLNWVILYTFWWVKKRFPQCAIKARSEERICLF